MFYSRADQIALAIAIIATQDSAERATVSRIGAPPHSGPVIAAWHSPQPDPIFRTTFKPLHA